MTLLSIVCLFSSFFLIFSYVDYLLYVSRLPDGQQAFYDISSVPLRTIGHFLDGWFFNYGQPFKEE